MIINLPFPVRINWIPKRASKARDTYFKMTAPVEIPELDRSELNYVGRLNSPRIDYYAAEQELWSRESSSNIGDQLLQEISSTYDDKTQGFNQGTKSVLHRSPLLVWPSAVGRENDFSFGPHKNFTSGVGLSNLTMAKTIKENTYNETQSLVQSWVSENMRLVEGMVFTRRPFPIIRYGTVFLRGQKSDNLFEGDKYIFTKVPCYDYGPNSDIPLALGYATKDNEEIIDYVYESRGVHFDDKYKISTHLDADHILTEEDNNLIVTANLRDMARSIRYSFREIPVEAALKERKLRQIAQSIDEGGEIGKIEGAIEEMIDTFHIIAKGNTTGGDAAISRWKDFIPGIEAMLLGRKDLNINRERIEEKYNQPVNTNSEQYEAFMLIVAEFNKGYRFSYGVDIKLEEYLELQSKIKEHDPRMAHGRISILNLYETIIDERLNDQDHHSEEKRRLERALEMIGSYKQKHAETDAALAVTEAIDADDVNALFQM